MKQLNWQKIIGIILVLIGTVALVSVIPISIISLVSSLSPSQKTLHEPVVMDSKNEIVKTENKTYLIDYGCGVLKKVYEIKDYFIIKNKNLENYSFYDIKTEDNIIYAVDSLFIYKFDESFNLLEKISNVHLNIKRIQPINKMLYYPITRNYKSLSYWKGPIARLSYDYTETIVINYVESSNIVVIDSQEFYLDANLYFHKYSLLTPFVDLVVNQNNLLTMKLNDATFTFSIEKDEKLLSYPISSNGVIYFSTYEKKINKECLLLDNNEYDNTCLCEIGKTYLYRYDFVNDSLSKDAFYENAFVVYYCADINVYYLNEAIYINKNIILSVDIRIDTPTNREDYYTVLLAKKLCIFCYFDDSVFFGIIDCSQKL